MAILQDYIADCFGDDCDGSSLGSFSSQHTIEAGIAGRMTLSAHASPPAPRPGLVTKPCILSASVLASAFAFASASFPGAYRCSTRQQISLKKSFGSTR